MTYITAYQLTKRLNKAGEKALGPKWVHVREQHMYNYKNNGQFAKFLVNGKLEEQAAMEFVTRFVNSRVQKLNSTTTS